MAIVKHQFVMDTAGHCFLCLKPAPATSKYEEADSEGCEPVHNVTVNTTKLFSFDRLCKHLKLNLKEISDKVTSSSSIIPVLLEEESELKGTLCEGCAVIFERFSNHFMELEKIQRKLHASLKSVYDKLVEVHMSKDKDKDVEEGEGNTLEEFKKEMLRRPETLQQFGMVELLRRTTLERCFLKLNTGPPPPPNQNPSVSVSDSAICESFQEAALALGDTKPEVKMDKANAKNETGPPPKPSHKKYYRYQRKTQRKPKKDYPFPCHLCENGFSKQMNLKRHLRAVHWKFRQACDLCGKKFTEKSSLIRHRRNIHFKNLLKASEKIRLEPAKSSEEGPSNLSTEEAEGEGDDAQPNLARTDYKCKYCPKRYGSSLGCRRHMTMAHNSKSKLGPPPTTFVEGQSYTVTSSSNSTPEDNYLPKMKYNTKTGKYRCTICSTEFPTHSEFQGHSKTAHLNLSVACYKCLLCGEEFDGLEDCKRHHGEVHGNGLR